METAILLRRNALPDLLGLDRAELEFRGLANGSSAGLVRSDNFA
jgi:hypothetical protein